MKKYLKFKNQKSKIITVIIFFSVIQSFSYSVFAQADAARERAASSLQAHEFSLYGGGGFSSLRYQLSLSDVSGGDTDVSGNYGFDYGFGYTRFLVTRWGVHTGIGLGFYGANALLDGSTTITRNLADSDGDLFDLHSALSDYSESQRAIYLNIPAMLQFQSQLDQGFYLKGGIKAGIPLVGKYESHGAKVTNTGFYPKYDNWATGQEFAGFGVFDEKSFDGNLELDVSLIFAFETGMKWRIGRNFSLYTGAYFDIGLNNAAKNQNMPFIAYSVSNAPEFTANSVLSSFSNRTNIIAAGVKLRLAFRR